MLLNKVKVKLLQEEGAGAGAGGGAPVPWSRWHLIQVWDSAILKGYFVAYLFINISDTVLSGNYKHFDFSQ